MADPTTANIQLSVPTRGSNVGTWDVPNNGDFTLIDAMLGAGITSKTLSSSNVTISISEAQVAILRFSGTLSANVQVTLPAIYKKWTIQNLCLGLSTYAITLTGGSGNVIGLPPGSCEVAWDGTNCYFVNYKTLGEYWDHPVATVPPWITACTVPPALNCNGSTFSSGTYPQLAELLGTTTLPSAKGAIRATLNQGTSNITTAGSGIDGNTRFSSGGAQTVTLARSNLPNVSVSVDITDPGHVHPYTRYNLKLSTGVDASGAWVADSTANTGSAVTGISASFNLNGNVSQTAVNNMPPTYIGGITLMWAV